MDIIGTIKNRPLLFGGVLVGGVVIIVALRASSAGEMTQSTPYGSDVGTGDYLQAMQMQINRDIAVAGMGAAASSEQTAAALEATRLDYEYKNNAATIAENIQLATLNATLQATTTQNTLLADVENKKTQATVDLAAINANAATQQQQILANALVQQSADQAKVSAAAIAAASQSKKCGFLGMFRC